MAGSGGKIEARFGEACRLHAAGRLAEAQAVYRALLDGDPRHIESWYLLGAAHLQLGHCDEAIECLRRALAIQPYYVDAHASLGEALLAKNCLEEAIAAFEQALTLKPNQAGPFINLGTAWQRRGDSLKALACFAQGIKLNPKLADGHFNLANLLRDSGQWDQAIACYQRAIALRPDFAEAHSNLGYSYKYTGRLEEAVAEFRQAIQLKPDHAAIGSGIAFLLQFHPGQDAAAIGREQVAWARRHAEPLTAAARPHDRPASGEKERRLRIGYVSPDFRHHCQSFFTVPLLAHHDHERFEIFCYADVEPPDALTQRLRSYSDAWRSTTGQTDEAVAEMIRADRIDILVDLTMHMARNRLLVFARKPAPLQITWLAYPGTTGLSAIDYRLSDPHLDPPGMFDNFYSERTLRLPDAFWCYDPLTTVPPVNPLPALAAGHITFGCLNNFCKVNEGVLELWSRALAAVPGSRMMMLCSRGAPRRRTLEIFARHGISNERIEFIDAAPRLAYLELYHRIDIALDTFPYNGHTTSLDAFWMGVPVVTLVGQTVVGRAGLCQLMNLNLPNFIARTPEEFVHIAARETADLSRLATLRGELRARMESSPLMNAGRFTKNMEAAYREIWRNGPLPGNP